MSKWVSLNIPLFYIDENKKKEVSKELGVKKPSEPLLNRECQKALGFSMLSIEKDFVKYNSNIKWQDFIYYFYNKNWIDERIEIENDNLKSNKYYGFYTDTYKNTYSIFKDDKFYLDLYDKLRSINVFKANHEKTKEYYKKLEEYNNLNKEVKKQVSFVDSPYNVRGMLIQLYSEKQNKYYSYLVGSGSDIRKHFRWTDKDMIVIRAKQLVEEEDIVGDLIFE